MNSRGLSIRNCLLFLILTKSKRASMGYKKNRAIWFQCFLFIRQSGRISVCQSHKKTGLVGLTIQRQAIGYEKGKDSAQYPKGLCFFMKGKILCCQGKRQTIFPLCSTLINRSRYTTKGIRPSLLRQPYCFREKRFGGQRSWLPRNPSRHRT